MGAQQLPAEAVDEEDADPVCGGQLGDGGGHAGDAQAGGQGGQQVGEGAAAVLGQRGGGQGEGFQGVPGRGLGHQRVTSAVASEMACAKASAWRTVSGPSPASLTRRLRSSAVELPV